MSLVNWSHDERRIADAIKQAGEKISAGLLEVAAALQGLLPPKADRLKLVYTGGNIVMGAPESANVGQVFNPTVVESNATTLSIPPIGPLVFASDNPAAASVDPNTGVVTANAAGVANVSVLDQGNNLTDTVQFTVAGTPPPPPPVATALSLSYQPAATRRR